MLLEKLKKFRKNQSLVEVSRREITSEDIICQIRTISDDFIQLTEYNYSGAYDGITIIYMDHISDILWESKSLESVEKLSRKLTHFEVPEVNLESMPQIITDLKEKFGAIEIWKETIGEGAQHGRVLDINDEWVHLEEFSPKHVVRSYKSLLRIGHITKVSTDTLYLKDLTKLYS
ncbi:MAG: hypothetical protein OEQ39_17220 [Gammaproteobacteria bacterium]|nr:hypothetical protein [Gammaproteobacteria bacterium]MDH3468082.1 hypothetical protein [Gammaproteobacteria bacterium]